MAETPRQIQIRAFGTIIRTETIALVLGLATGTYVWWAWFSEWATYDPDWRIRTDPFTRLFRGTHPFPHFNGDHDWSVSLFGGLLSELGFVLIVTAYLYAGRAITRSNARSHAAGLLLIALAVVSVLCLASGNALPLLSIPFVACGAFLVVIGSFSGPRFSLSPDSLEGFATVPFFCGLASLFSTRVYAYYYNYFRPPGEHAANPVPALLVVLCMSLIYSVPVAIQILRWKRFRLPWVSLRDFAWQVLLLPPVIFAVSSAAMIAFISFHPNYHRNGNAVWINLFFYIQTSCVNMLIVLFVFRSNGLESDMRRWMESNAVQASPNKERPSQNSDAWLPRFFTEFILSKVEGFRITGKWMPPSS